MGISAKFKAALMAIALGLVSQIVPIAGGASLQNAWAVGSTVDTAAFQQVLDADSNHTTGHTTSWSMVMNSGLGVTVSYAGGASWSKVYGSLRGITLATNPQGTVASTGSAITYSFDNSVSSLLVRYAYVDYQDPEMVYTDGNDANVVNFPSVLVNHQGAIESGQSAGVLGSDGLISKTSGSGSVSGVAELSFPTPISSITFEGWGYGGNLVGIDVPQPTISAPPTTSATYGQAFSSGAPTVSNFVSGALTYSLASGTLPAGLSLNSSTGVISGTPTAAGDQTVSIKALHADGGSGATSANFTISVAKANQVISWAPSTSLELADSGLTLSATLTAGDGSLGYEVVSTGTTGCSVSGSTLSFSSIGSGANGCEVRPTAEVSSNYNAKTDAATVTFDVSRGSFAITAPSSKVGTSSSTFTDVCTSSCDVSGFAASDEILVVVNKSGGSALSGEVKLTSTTGLTQSITGYQSNATATGLHELAFEGTQAEVNAALETLQYKSPLGGGDETIGISASLSGAAYFAGNGHYYEAVTSPTKSWEDARDAAAASTFNGLTGYLVTITSDEENAFVYQKTGVNTWIGASDNYLEVNAAAGTSFANQSAAEGSWYWVTGPEAGTQFWSGNSSGSAVSSRYENWSSGEPNDYPNAGTDGEEDYGHLIGRSGLWNDYPENLTLAYVIEYGGNGGTVLKQASTTFDVGAPTAPLQVSGVSVSAGNAQLTVSWTAPGTGGSAITDYVIEQSTDGGTTWTTLTDGTSTSTSFTVTGLTNGSSYSFRVSAKNAIGTGTASSSASGTPAVPAATSTSRSNNDDDEPVVTPVVTPTVTRPTVRLPFPTPTPPRPTVLSAPVKTPTSVSTPVDRLVSRIGGVPAPVTTSTNGDDELSVSTSSMRLSLKMSQQASVSESSDASAELTIKPGAKAAVTATGLLPNTTLQVWLPNVSERELGRLSVNAAGEITGELGLSSNLGEEPLPIGRQTLQMTGYDADGNQTVVEMPVNIAQGPPTPEPNREAAALPDLSPGQSLGTSAGVPTSVVVTPFSDQRAVAVDGGDWSLSVAVADQDGDVGGTSESPLIRMTQSGQGVVTGDGFQPGTVASLWMFSEPTLLGTVTVAEDGSFDAQFLVDVQFIPAGEHTLQVQGVGTDGYIKAANLGVLVDAAPVETTADSALTLIWWVLAALLLFTLLIVLVVTRRRRRA